MKGHKYFHQPRLVSRLQELVPTTQVRHALRDTGRYDSSDRLPDIERLFDRTLNQIKSIHAARTSSSKSFDALWKLTCRRLALLQNATSYAHRKQQDILRNASSFEAVDEELARAFARMDLVAEVDGVTYMNRSNEDEIVALRDKRASLKSDIRESVDDALEIVIAYWIEARNAYNDGDRLRALNCLIECHFFLGITHSPKTNREAKREAGRRSGKGQRDALARAILTVADSMKVDEPIRDGETLRAMIYQMLETHPEHVGALRAYDEWATKGKNVEDALADRFSETLRKWMTGKRQPYPQLTACLQNLLVRSQAYGAITQKCSS